MSGNVSSTLVDRAYDPKIRLALSLEDGAEYYFELSDKQASQLASNLSRVVHDVDEDDPHNGRVPDDPEGLEDVRQVMEDAGIDREP